MRVEPNLSMLFTELPLLERPAAAAAAGFTAAELWWPFDLPDPGAAEIDALAAAFEMAGLELACLNFDGGDFSAGERGLLGVPGHEERFHANIDVAVDLARRLRCTTLNALYGNPGASTPHEEHAAVAIANLAAAASAADRIGARIVVEAINALEYPDYGLHTVEEVVTFLDQAQAQASVQAWCSLDVYHVGFAGADVVDVIRRFAGRIGHVQVADVPGRHEPGTGSLDFEAILGSLGRHGYDGWIGLEYVPSMDSDESVRLAVDQLGRGAYRLMER